MRHRSGDRRRRVGEDSALTARILTPRGPEMGHREGRSAVADLGRASLSVADRAALLMDVNPAGIWRPIESP
jgi:hypothetical protein